MTGYTSRDLSDLRWWYRKWAIRYSLAYSVIGVAVLFFPSFLMSKSVLSVMTIISVMSTIHLWRAIKISLIVGNRKMRSRFGLFGNIVIWSGLGGLVIFSDLNSGPHGGALVLLFFIGPPLAMWEAYINQIEKGE